MGMKDTKGKEKLRYIPYEALKQVALVREFGTQKYGDPFGYMGVDADDFVDAALRHLYKHLWLGWEDPESSLSHLAHAACSILLAIDNLRSQGCLLSEQELKDCMNPEFSIVPKGLKPKEDLPKSYTEFDLKRVNRELEELGQIQRQLQDALAKAYKAANKDQIKYKEEPDLFHSEWKSTDF